MKRLLAITICFIMAAAVCGCAKSPSPAEKKETVSMFDLAESMRSAMPRGEQMEYASKSDENAEDEFAHVSAFDYDKVEDFFILYAKDGKTSADEIVVIALKDASDADAALETLSAHVTRRSELYSVYEPSLLPVLNDARLFTHAQYAVLIVGDDNGSAEEAFKSFIG